MSDDAILLQRYARERDAEAFNELVQRYAGLVHSACLRVTNNTHLAEDAAQECFLNLARDAGAIHSHLASWLHATATHRSKDALRSAARRRHHEEQVMAHKSSGADDPTWQEIGPHVDIALAELPEELRLPIILHFLEQKSQTEVAAELGVDQSTVSRRIEKGVGELRSQLEKAGVVASLALLTGLLAENAMSVAAPVSLQIALGKMALAGISQSAAIGGASGAGATGILATVKAKVVAVVLISVLAVAGVVFHSGPEEGPVRERTRGLKKEEAVEDRIPLDSSRKGSQIGNDQHGKWLQTPLGMRFRWIPAGELTMQHPSDEKNRREMKVDRGFWMGETEVTVDQFKTFVDATGHETDAEYGDGGWVILDWSVPQGRISKEKDANWRNPHFKQEGRHPVVLISWNDCQEYVKWLNKLDPDGGYRLPYEAEWEYACRAGTTTHFHYGDSLNAQMANIRTGPGPFRKATVNAASFQPNAWGLFDMHGNAWEWCEDNFWSADNPDMDPTRRAVRGGGWDDGAMSACRSSHSTTFPTSERYYCVGLRVVIANPESHAVEKKDEGTEMTKDGKHAEVVLRDALSEYLKMKEMASHSNLRNFKGSYPQPYVHITRHYACMRAAGRRDVSFDDLMTLSGSSLLFIYEPKAWEVKRGPRMVGDDQRINEVFGFGWEWLEFNDPDEAWDIIKQTIDSGRPAAAEYIEGSLFLGYQDAPEVEQRRVFMVADILPEGENSQVWWTWKQFAKWVRQYVNLKNHIPGYKLNRLGRHTAETPRLGKKRAALQTMENAIAWSDSIPDSARVPLKKIKDGQFRFGLDGIRAYAEDIADVENRPEDYFDSPWHGCHAINPQWTARKSTAEYFKGVVEGKIFPEQVSKHLGTAADEYAAAYAAWQGFYQQLGYVAPKGAWSIGENRTKGAAAVRKAAGHEAKAIEALRMALTVHRGQTKAKEGGMRLVKNFEENADYRIYGFGELLALRDCLKGCGVEAEWDDILGFSGDAFGCDNMDYPSVRVNDVLLLTARAYGFEAARWAFGEEASLSDLRAEISAGRPAIVGAGKFVRDSNIVCWHFLAAGGYDTVNDRLLVSGAGRGVSWGPIPAEDGVKGRWNAQCPWATGAPTKDGVRCNWHGSPRFLLGTRKGTPALKDLLVKALQAGVDSYRSPVIEMNRPAGRAENSCGREYLTAWPAKLQGWSEKIRKKPIDENDGDPMNPGYFGPIAVSTRRRAAVAFLRKHAGQFPEGARARIRAAVTHYERSASCADKLFETLYAVEGLEELDWRERLLAVKWYIGEGPRVPNRVAAYAEQHPDRWRIRTLVIRRVNETFGDPDTVQKAQGLVTDILNSDDAAIAEIEAALKLME